MSDAVTRALKNHPKSALRNTLVLSIILALAIWSALAIDYQGVNDQGVTVVGNILRYLVWPDINPDRPVIAKYLLSFERFAVPYLMLETIMIAFIGTLLGAVISIPFAFLSSKNIVGEKKSLIGATVITMIRTVPIFIWGIIFIRVQGGAMAGVLAISISSVGMISKLYIEVIEDIDKGILEALDSTGATAFQKIRYGIIPQLTTNFLSVGIYRFEINVRNATILGLVGAGGIGFTLIDALGSFNFGIVAVSLWGIIPVVLLIEYVSTKVRNKLT